jgi:non-ribosomal peptide synthetase component F
LLSELNPITFNKLKSNKIYDLIGVQAQKFPDKTAIKHNLESITYKELELSSNQIAVYFKNCHFKNGQVIAVAMDRSIQMTVCLLGLMKAGITYLPIDPNLPLERVKFLIEDSSASTLVTSVKYNELYESFSNKLFFDEIWRNRTSYINEIIDLKVSGDDLTYIIYTSGSTGLPKGVAISHYSLLNLLLSRQHGPGVDENDNMLGITTISFDIAEEE